MIILFLPSTHIFTCACHQNFASPPPAALLALWHFLQAPPWHGMAPASKPPGTTAHAHCICMQLKSAHHDFPQKFQEGRRQMGFMPQMNPWGFFTHYLKHHLIKQIFAKLSFSFSNRREVAGWEKLWLAGTFLIK